jgi:wyosine [tRNA(Phe)-imidazoG37] synthetase (radical SAM superfamily)
MAEALRPRLSVTDHSRSSAGLRYVYPVVSRRAGGVSIGINLNTNNACNWRCIYCQVPDLIRGVPPPVDLALLRRELSGFLNDVLHGDFLAARVPADARRLNDIALSGNGEPTSAREFGEVVELIGKVRVQAGVPQRVKTVLITNGSLAQRAAVQQGIERLAALNGEVWFKLDSGTEAGLRKINNARLGLSRVRANLGHVAHRCSTWIQTCLFTLSGAGPDAAEAQAYVQFLRTCLDAGIELRGVLLYSLARASLQPEAKLLGRLSPAQLEAFAEPIRALGLIVQITP